MLDDIRKESIEDMKGQNLFYGKILPAVFVLLGLLLLWSDISDVSRGWGSANWSQTEGIVKSSKVREHMDRVRTLSDGRESTTSVPKYEPSLIYSYTVEGVEWEGYRIAVDAYGYSDREAAQRVVDRYPKGQRVQIHYDPDNPEDSLLEPGLKAFPWGGILSSLRNYSPPCE